MLKNISILWKILLPILGGGALTLALTLWIGQHSKEALLEESGLSVAEVMIAQAAQMRQIYASEIVPAANEGGVVAHHEWDRMHGAVPPAASLVSMVGEAVAQQMPGVSLRLYSDEPFTHRDLKLDGFEQRSLEALMQNANQPYYELGTQEGVPVLRYAVADVMENGCVACHNSHGLSPRHNWQVGDMRGAVGVSVPLGTVESRINSSFGLMQLTIVGAIVVLIVVLALAAQQIAKMIRRVSARISHSAANLDLTGRFEVSCQDELGTMSRDLNTLYEALQSTIKEAGRGAHENASVSSELSSTARQIGMRAENSLEAVRSGTEEIAQIEQAVEQASDRALAVSEQARQARHQLDTVETRMNQMAQSVQSRSVEQNDLAEKLNRLNQEADQVRGILTVINDIADQTNLLALNAAIEAARAGEHGRGFAVVADEVRNLADRTQKALTEINATLNVITQSVVEASDEMGQSATAIESLRQSSEETANEVGAVSAQMRSAQEGVQESAQTLQELLRAAHKAVDRMKAIEQEPTQSSRSVEEIASASEHMDGLVEKLRSQMARFKV